MFLALTLAPILFRQQQKGPEDIPSQISDSTQPTMAIISFSQFSSLPNLANYRLFSTLLWIASQLE
jgi:hypothetical protein